MLPTVLELWPNEADPVEVRPHGEASVFFLHLFVVGVLLSKRLMVEC